uniref:Putative secreted protein n=1 Tax=Anopheles darlingi TaxID=43151 RepID=A0A2M4D6H0_ANODA
MQSIISSAVILAVANAINRLFNLHPRVCYVMCAPVEVVASVHYIVSIGNARRRWLLSSSLSTLFMERSDRLDLVAVQGSSERRLSRETY